MLFFFCFTGIVCPSFGHSEQYSDLLQEVACGSINWSTGALTATGISEFQDDADEALSQPELAQHAYRQACRNLLEVLIRIRIDDHHRVSDVIEADQSLLARLQKMTHQATVLDQMHLADGRVQVSLQTQISGAFAQLILPVTIKQVETIKPITMAAPGSDAKSLTDSSSQTLEVYTGLIVDARGIGVLPAMVPLILDENGKEIYGPAFISREYAVQYRTCDYVRTPEIAVQLARAGPNPLIIKGLRAKSQGSCNILVSAADAAKLRGISAHLNFLKECRVVIVLD